MAQVPGSVGLPVFSDQSLNFNSSPVEFVKRCIDHHSSRVLASRLLNKATVFVCSNQGVRQVLTDSTDAFDLGYRVIMEKMYNENLLFINGDEASAQRDRLSELFTDDAIQTYRNTIERMSFGLYRFFRQLVAEINLTLFLGLDFSETEEANRVVQLTLRHWHGMVSVPVKLKLPGTSLESYYSKAAAAKKELMQVIQNQRGKATEGFVRQLQEAASEEDEDFIHNHMLLFSSAMAPKAMASLLTSFMFEMGRPERVAMQAQLLSDQQLLDNVFREVQRMYPPFLAGRRVTKKEVVIDGYRIPADYGVVYVTQAAHRDPAVFSNPDSFTPERWADGSGLSDDNLFALGQGPRSCLASQLVFSIIDTVVRQLLSRYQWTLPAQQDLTLKWLPVLRPKVPVMMNLMPLYPQTDTDIIASPVFSSSPSDSESNVSDTSTSS